MATHSSILAWKIPWTEEPSRLQSTGSQRVGHDWATSLSLSHNATYRFTTFLIQISMKIFTNMEQTILKFVWNHKRPWIAKEILRKNDRSVVLPDFKLYCKAILIKQYGIAIKMDTNHWNRIVIPETNPNICG